MNLVRVIHRESQTFGPVLSFQNFIATTLQEFGCQFPHRSFIFTHQDRLAAPRHRIGLSNSVPGAYRFSATWQVNLEGGSSAFFAVNPNEPAALFNDAVDRCEPEPCSLPHLLRPCSRVRRCVLLLPHPFHG